MPSSKKKKACRAFFLKHGMAQPTAQHAWMARVGTALVSGGA